MIGWKDHTTVKVTLWNKNEPWNKSVTGKLLLWNANRLLKKGILKSKKPLRMEIGIMKLHFIVMS